MTLDYLKELQEALAEGKSNIMKKFDFWLDVAMCTLNVMLIAGLILLALTLGEELLSMIFG